MKFYLHKFHGDQFEPLLFESFDDIRNKTSVNSIWFEHEECSLLVFLVIVSHSQNLFFGKTVIEYATDRIGQLHRSIPEGKRMSRHVGWAFIRKPILWGEGRGGLGNETSPTRPGPLSQRAGAWLVSIGRPANWH